MTPRTAALRGRLAAQRLMTDNCTITRAGVGEPVYNPATDTFTNPATTTVYQGKCKIRSRQAMANTADAGEDVVVVARRELHLPVTATGVSDVRVNDVATITVSTNPNLAGKRFRISDLGEDQTHQTARRLGVEQSD